jgi:subtilisin family serine protease
MHPSRHVALLLAFMAGCAAPVGGPPRDESPASLIVRFHAGSPESERQAIRLRYGVSAQVGALPDTEKWLLPAGVEPVALRPAVASEEAIKYATPNYVRHVLGYKASDLTTTYADGQWALGQIRAPEAWDAAFSAQSPPGKGVTVAVVDSGVDVRHPDLKDNIARDGAGNPVYIDVLHDASGSFDTCNGKNYDWVTAYRGDGVHLGPDGHGHGTHVSGIIAASDGNGAVGGRKLIGVAPAATILPVKTMDCRGDGQDWDIAYGIKAAADQGARIMNLSIGGPEPSALLEDALAYALAKNVLIVVAAGNGGGSPVFYPAAYSGVIAVGSVSYTDAYQSYSNVGPEVGMVAPGGTVNQATEGILSSVPTYASEMSKAGAGWARVSGTSQASPFVAGAAALIWSREPSLTLEQVRQRLYASAKDLGTKGFDNKYGWGRLDVAAALQLGDHRYATP